MGQGSYHGIGHVDAGDFGFRPGAGGLDNSRALQQALDRGGTVTVREPGVYDIAATAYIASHTSLVFGAGATLRKVPERGDFAYVLLNKGARTGSCDAGISIEGLRLQVNGVDTRAGDIYGLIGQLAFFHVQDLRIEGFRCEDLGRHQFAIHVCTFEDLLVQDVIIRGDKDGVHLGRGRRFAIRDGVFQTHDDAVALNAHDYATSNPELGWIEDGVIERCHDLPEPGGKPSVGFFCRLLGGAWTDWRAGMQVQHSDTVISHGRLYRVQARPDGEVYASTVPPAHAARALEQDGINWGLVQQEAIHTAGVRNVVFRDIFLHNERTSFSVHFDNDRYSRSYYPGAVSPVQQGISLESVRVLHDAPTALLRIDTPLDCISLSRCRLGRGGLLFRDGSELRELGHTAVSMVGCTFASDGEMQLLTNEIAGKSVSLHTAASAVTHKSFIAKTIAGEGQVIADSDLPGLTETGGEPQRRRQPGTTGEGLGRNDRT
jgi:hypothetical protein